MDITTLVTFSTLVLAILALLYTIYRNRKTDVITRQKSVDLQLEELRANAHDHSERFKRVNLHIKLLQENQTKLEAVVENQLNKLEQKIDKVHDLLIGK